MVAIHYNVIRFVDDAVFSYHEANGHNDFKEVRQVAAPVGHETTTAFGRCYQHAAPGGSLLYLYD